MICQSVKLHGGKYKKGVRPRLRDLIFLRTHKAEEAKRIKSEKRFFLHTGLWHALQFLRSENQVLRNALKSAKKFQKS